MFFNVFGSYDLGQKYYALKFDPTGVRTHDLQIMTDSTFHVTETPTLTTWPSVTSSLLSSSWFTSSQSEHVLLLWGQWKFHGDKSYYCIFNGANVAP